MNIDHVLAKITQDSEIGKLHAPHSMGGRQMELRHWNENHRLNLRLDGCYASLCNVEGAYHARLFCDAMRARG